MNLISKEEQCSVYLLTGTGVRAYVVSTPETRKICNDPLLYGVQYTEALKNACARALPHVAENLREAETSVVHLLRGGLNFGLREALATAFDWNAHSSTFLSAQRRRKDSNPEEWEISEADYRKLVIPDKTCLVMGDVVASGASLQFGVESVLRALAEQRKSLRSILFFTIGGPQSEGVFRNLEDRIKKSHPEYEGTTVVYFEGRFPVAEVNTPLTIKITGTDLLRHGSGLAPEFVESQYEAPTFPVERCTIYDAGSRAFEPTAYLRDLLDYWESVERLESPVYLEYVAERFPTVERSRLSTDVSLRALAQERVSIIKSELARFSRVS